MDGERRLSGSVLTIAVTSLLLIGCGLAGIHRGDVLEGGSFLSRQVVWIALGSMAATLAFWLPYRRTQGWGWVLYAISIFLLVIVFLFPPKNGARRWIPVGPISVQPSELAKIALILALGEYLMFRRNHRSLLGLIPPFLMTAVPVLLILKEPDLGTALLFFPILYAMLFIAGARRTHLFASIAAGILTLPILWVNMSTEQKSRVTAVFQQADDGTPEPGDGYHLFQSKQLLALGGKWGSDSQGDRIDDPAAYRLPAGRTDFVYSLIGERWGLPGTIGLQMIFATFVLAGCRAASQTRDPYGRLIATGIVTLLAAQVLINTAMTVGLAPITGLTLPLVSYGGSSFLTTAFCIGLLINVASSPGFDVAGQPFDFRESVKD